LRDDDRESRVTERLDGATRVYYVVGDPITQAKAPARMTQGFVQCGLNAVLVPMHVAARDLDAFMHGASSAQNVDGMIMTVPHKLAAYRYCATTTERARCLGATNVLRRDAARRWFGETTDGASFVAGIRAAGFKPRGLRALVAGAGGAASAIALELLESGIEELAIHSRTAETRDRLVDLLHARHPAAIVRAGTADPTGFDLVVNGTPAGMNTGDPLPVTAERLTPAMFVGDVITVPEITPLLAAAREIGCRTATGLDMVNAAIGLMLDFFLAGNPPAA
jgi:shikimate dehydrogenase